MNGFPTGRTALPARSFIIIEAIMYHAPKAQKISWYPAMVLKMRLPK